MFTGIAKCVGNVRSIADTSVGKRIEINAGDLDLQQTKPGDSIAVNGVCVTVVEFESSAFAADISRETLACTSLGNLSRGGAVNLEHALTLQSLISGHLVTGHVDGLGRISEVTRESDHLQLRVDFPPELARYISRKGSIAVDGVSLTVNAVYDFGFKVQIIPHTLSRTIIGSYATGTLVNLEVDLIARYLERLLATDVMRAPKASGGITKDLLERHGFIKPEGISK